MLASFSRAAARLHARRRRADAAGRRGVRPRAAGRRRRPRRWRSPSGCAAPCASASPSIPAAVSVSIGVATSGRSWPRRRALMRAANRALYAAKHLGRDRCVAYHAADARDARRGPRGRRRGPRAARRRDAPGRDARPARRRHRAPLRDGRAATRSRSRARSAGTAARVARVRAAGILHDIGKLGISDAILHKPGKLDAARVGGDARATPSSGARILEHANLRDIAGWVLAHHERVDGARLPARARRRTRSPSRRASSPSPTPTRR